MKKLHHIIVAIDFTPYCRSALREAARRASMDGAQLTAVHVMDEFLVHELKRRWPRIRPRFVGNGWSA